MKSKKLLKKEKALLKDIKGNFSKLKKYDRLETREEIQIIKYDVPVEYFDFKEKKVIDYYNPFAIMLGLIDGFIDSRQKQIQLYKNDKVLYRYEIEINYAKTAREEICSNMKNTEYKIIERDRNATKSIRNSILSSPSHIKFSDIYEEGQTSKYDRVYVAFVDSYNRGYSLANSFKLRNVEYMYANYKQLFGSLNEKYIENEKKIHKVKTKENKKRYPNY